MEQEELYKTCYSIIEDLAESDDERRILFNTSILFNKINDLKNIMGSTTDIKECKTCKGVIITTRVYNKNRVSSNCSCSTLKFKQMYEKDFNQMHMTLQDDSLSECVKRDNYSYWQKRVNGRFKELTPLIEELKEKKIELISLSKELHDELIELNNVKLFYNF